MKVIDIDELRSVPGDELAGQQHPNDETGQDDCQQVGGDQSDRCDQGDGGKQGEQGEQGEQNDRGDHVRKAEEAVLSGHHEEASDEVADGAPDDPDDSSDDSGGDTDGEEDDYEGTSTDESVTDDSEDDTDEESDNSTDESAHSRRTRKTTNTLIEPMNKEKPKQQKDKDNTIQFDFDEVIDNTSKTPEAGQIEDEDIGGEVVTAATTIAGASAISCFHAKRSLLVGIAVAILVACVLYYIWRKFEDMKNKLLQLQQQQEMSLNDKDVQFISSQVLQDYLREEGAKNDTSDYSTSGTDTSAENDVLETIEETSEKSSDSLQDLGHDISEVVARELPPSADVPGMADKDIPPAACAPETSEVVEKGSSAECEAVEREGTVDSATPTGSTDPEEDPGEEQGTGIDETTSDIVTPLLQDPEKHDSQGLGTLEDELEDDKPRRRSRRVKT